MTKEVSLRLSKDNLAWSLREVKRAREKEYEIETEIAKLSKELVSIKESIGYRVDEIIEAKERIKELEK